MNRSRLVFSVALLMLTTAAVCVSAQCLMAADASTVTIDWSARTTGQQACIAPSASGSTAATLTLTNANTILYTYTLDVKSYQLPSNDAGNIPAAAAVAPPAAPGAPPPPSQEQFNRALAYLLTVDSLFPSTRRSVPLDETMAAFKNAGTAAAIAYVISNSAMFANSAPEELKPVASQVVVYLQKYQAITANNNQSTISFPYQIDNTHYYVFTIREKSRYNGKLTDAMLTWKCGLEDILTLSVGVMATTLPYRTYVSQSVPNGSSTQNVLVVNGASGWTPQGLALLNYKLFVLDSGPQPGFAFSTGPAFKFGGTPGVSDFGWFAGISLSLWRRLFITPGIQLGQFADFPAGFSRGSVIPANFGTLTPVTRWSGHFALGITFQTNSFVKSNAGTPATSPPAKPGS